MFTPVPRFLLLILLAGLSVLFAYVSWVPLLLLTTLLSLFLLWDYLKRGTVPLAMSKVRKENYFMAEKILSFTQYPSRLQKRQQVYYNFAKGFIARDNDNFPEAESYLNLVKNANLKNEHDRAMVLLALADIAMIKKEKAKAKDLLLQMKDLKVDTSLMPAVRKMQQWVLD